MSATARLSQKQQKKNQKLNQKLNGGASAAAVVQPIQVQQVQPQAHLVHASPSTSPAGIARPASPPPTAIGSMRLGTIPSPHPLKEPFLHQRGQSVKPQSVPESTLVSSMAELVQEVIPQGTNSQNAAERVDWMSIQKCSAVSDARRIIDVIVVGLARGYQIWALMENGDCEEVLSERQGPLLVGRLLTSNPESSFGVHEDRFARSRPLFALVDATSHVSERQFSAISFLSLLTAQFVHRLSFPDPICAFQASSKILVVSFLNRIVVCDAMSLEEQRYIYNGQIYDSLATPFAISDIFLAYADTNLVQVDQSCGGMGVGEETSHSSSSYTSSVMNVAKSLSRTVSALGETVVSSLSSSPHSKYLLSSISHPGIVTVVDANKLPSEKDSESDRSEAVIAHFVAHAEPIGFLAFSRGGQLILTSGQSSTCFHIFIMYPHAAASALGAVRHIYTLCRGTTPAKVLDCAFSTDNRWLALATNHGTTHVFAICPYGGPVTMRTHSGRLVNKESRFHRSAGLVDGDAISTNKSSDSSKGHQFGAPLIYKEHPALCRPCVARSVLNPRIGPYPNPIALNAVAKIRQRFLSADNLSAWASDLTAVSLSTGKRGTGFGNRNVELHRLSISFASNAMSSSEYPSLLVASEGAVTEYSVEVTARGTTAPAPHPTSTATNNLHSRLSCETPIVCALRANAHWLLQRNKSSADLRAPLTEHNPLLVWLNAAKDTDDEKENTDGDPSDMNEKWISQIEVLTYSEPNRRLWMGPQFTFKKYLSSGHSSADLVSPSDGGDRSFIPVNSVKSVPVMIEAAGSLRNFNVSEPTQIICGSWSSEADYKSCDEHHDVLREKIEEAMQELALEHSACSSKGRGEDTSSETSQGSPRSGTRSSRNSRDRDSISLQFANIDM